MSKRGWIQEANCYNRQLQNYDGVDKIAVKARWMEKSAIVTETGSNVMLRIYWVTTNSQYDSNAKLESGTLKINLKCQRILISINCVTEITA